jgi:hypothetical protein
MADIREAPDPATTADITGTAGMAEDTMGTTDMAEDTTDTDMAEDATASRTAVRTWHCL